MKPRPPESTRLAVALFLALLAVGALAYLAALDLQLDARDRLNRETARLRAAEQDLRSLPDRLAMADRSEADFRAMTRRGFVGPGDRLDWVSQLARLGREGGLDSLSWHIEPRRFDQGHHGLWVTPMTLRGSPITARGLDDLLGGLAETARGRFSVESCVLTAGDGPGQMECRLLWWNWQEAP